MGNEFSVDGLDFRLKDTDDIVDKVNKDVDTDKEQSPTQILLKGMFESGLIDKTEFSNEEIGHFSRLYFLGRLWGIEEITKFVEIFALLRISHRRQGRIEGFSIAEKETEAKIKANQPAISFFGGKLPTF